MDGPGHIPCSVMVGSGTCLHPAGVGGSQFTVTLWMGYSQTPEIENGDRHGELGPPKPAGGRQVPDPTMTEHGICPRASICYIYSGIK